MRKWVAGLLLSISVILLTISLYFLIGFFMQERQDNQLQQELQELMQKREDESEEDASGDSLIEIDAGILALHEENPDCIGWLTIDGTRIDYPVMYTPDDNDYYLHLDFDKNWSDPGTPFIDTNCRPFDDRTDNVLIYGHNMKSGIMFRELLQYEDESFYKKHKNIKFDTLYETGTYEVIGAFRSEIYPDDDTEHYHYYEFFNAADKAEFDEYIDFVKSNTSYDSGVTAEYGDELITLSTCASHTEDGRFVVVARRITGDDK